MSVNDQADGFYESPYFCGKCGPDVECMCVLPPQKPMGPLYRGSQRTLSELTTMPYGMRLARGFAILSGNKHDL